MKRKDTDCNENNIQWENSNLKATAHLCYVVASLPTKLYFIFFTRKFTDLRTFDNSKGFLCDQEQKFQAKRKLYIHTAIQKLLNTELKVDDVSMLFCLTLYISYFL